MEISKTVNKEQAKILVNLFEAHRDIACGFHRGNKEEVVQFCKRAQAELNSAGPPSKSICEWKKVWADKKKYVRQKAVMNLKNKHDTGGGPNADYNFSTLERAVFDLVGMKQPVEGVSAQTFGLCSLNQKLKSVEGKENVPVAEQVFPRNMENSLDESISYFMECEAQQVRTEDVNKPCPEQRKQFKKKSPASDALEKEIEIQTQLCASVKEGFINLQENHESTKNIYRSIDKLYEIKKKKHFREMKEFHAKQLEVQKEELLEIKRHNREMEKLRQTEVREKIEKYRRLLEIEELKAVPSTP